MGRVRSEARYSVTCRCLESRAVVSSHVPLFRARVWLKPGGFGEESAGRACCACRGRRHVTRDNGT
eukprot:1181752-Rhodomonas_salina.1